MGTRILLVGDPGASLDRLRESLVAVRPGWEVLTAGSRSSALAVFGALQVYAVVVSDSLGDAEAEVVLAHAAQGHPATARLLLGTSSRDLTAHATLASSTAADELASTLDHLIDATANEVADQTVPVQALIGSVDTLPSSPAIWTKLRTMIADPDVEIRDLADTVSRDVGTSAKVLRLVNSAFFGLPRHVSDLREAIAMLGIRTISSLVLSSEVLASFQALRHLPGLDVDALCGHGLASGVLARQLVPKRADAEDAFVAGLMQDVGQLALASAVTDGFRACLAEAAWRGVPLHVVERERLGYDHAQAGAALLVLWQMPISVVDAVASSHEPIDLDRGLDVVTGTRLGHLLTTTRWVTWRDANERGDISPLERETEAALAAWELEPRLEDLGLALAGEMASTGQALQV